MKLKMKNTILTEDTELLDETGQVPVSYTHLTLPTKLEV